MNKRRKLVVALGASAFVAAFSSFAQQPGKVWRIGFLSQNSRPDSLDSGSYGEFRRGLRERGYVEGKNLTIELRYADHKPDRLFELATDLVQLKVDVILTAGTPSARAAQKATTTIPIVFGSAGDPVGSGLVKSLAHPGGNITGLTNISGDLSPKHLEMLTRMVPKLSSVAVLVNPSNPAHITILKNVESAAQSVGVKMLSAEARTPQEIESAFSAMSRGKAGAIITEPDGFFLQQARQIAELSMKYRLPSISGYPAHAEAGGLMSYGSDIPDQYRRAATLVDKIFKGAKPADLPIEQPTKFVLIINAKTAKTLGLKIPQSLLISADKVIE